MSFLGGLLKAGTLGLYGIDPVLGYAAGRAVDKFTGGGGGGGTGTGLDVLNDPKALAQFDQAYPNYRATYNASGGAAGLNGRSYQQWLSDHFKAYPNDATNLAALKSIGLYQSSGSMTPPGAPAASGGSDPNAVPITPDSAGTQVPVEKGIYDLVAPRLLDDINQDTDRRTLANTLGGQATSAYNSAYGSLQSALGPTFDAEAYYAAYPDVAAAYANSDHSMTAVQFAQNHYEKLGKNEGRTGNYSSQLQRENQNADNTAASISANAQTSANSQLAAIQQFASTAKASLTGELAARADALEKQITALTANAHTLSDSEKASLATQIAAQGKNLEDSISAQKTNLATQMDQLGQANDADATARRAALTDMMDKLNAAQAPLNSARTQAAQDQVTAVNLGLQRTNDQLTAKQAEQGYVGGDSASDMNLARAAIGARQQAAQAVGGANVSNATDNRDIGVTGATQGRSLEDQLSANRLGLATFGANSGRTLSDALATGKQTLGDTSATQTRAIEDQLSGGLYAINNGGATTGYNNALYGAAGNKSIEDQANQGTLNTNTNLAQQIQLANNANAAAKSNYFDNNYTRSLQSAMAMPSLTSNLTNSLTGLDNYANSGLNRSLSTLNWWSTNATPSTPGFVAVQPSQSGNGLAQLGAGITGAAINIGNANNWWQTPATKVSGIGSSTNTGTSLNYSNPTGNYNAPLIDAGRTTPITTGGYT